MKSSIIEKLGLKEKDFKPQPATEERITDLEEAFLVLTELLLEESSND